MSISAPVPSQTHQLHLPRLGRASLDRPLRPPHLLDAPVGDRALPGGAVSVLHDPLCGSGRLPRRPALLLSPAPASALPHPGPLHTDILRAVPASRLPDELELLSLVGSTGPVGQGRQPLPRYRAHVARVHGP